MFAIIGLLCSLSKDNILTPAETKAGFKLLFDGKSTKGWTNFNSDKIGSGWTVTDGVLKCSDPHHGGDIVTEKKFDWFELLIDVKIDPGQNSGIMFHVADSGEATWHSGPEIQIYDHKAEPGVQITGYLYELYSSNTDATKPSGEWNHMRIVIDPKKCFTEVNGVRYYEYVLNSEEFWTKVKASKFNEFPEFSKLTKGRIGIQGDHGVVSFKNIKIREIKQTNRA